MGRDMAIRGIMFDKDGTLLDFNRLWLDITNIVVANICDRYLSSESIYSVDMLTQRIKAELGINNEEIRYDSPLAYMTYKEMAGVVYDNISELITDTKEQFEQIFEQEYNRAFSTMEFDCIPTCNIIHLFDILKDRNIRIGLATADNKNNTEKCLKKMHIYEYFDYIGCDDSTVRPKPCADMFDIFCEKYNLKSDEVIICGDTVNDMIFAGNCKAHSAGVLCGLTEYEDMCGKAEYIIDNPEKLIDII